MSGHNKWSQIKRQKGVTDARRSQRFSKLANVISAAARVGGGDPDMNPRLRIAIEQARSENMPNDNIDRAIARGTSTTGGVAMEELRFEAYGPAGIGILIDVATDSRNRANAEIKAVLVRRGGKLAAAHAVAYQFTERGILTVPSASQDREALELALIEAGALDYEDQGDALIVTTDSKEVSLIKQKLTDQKITVAETRLSFEPNQTVTVSDEVTARAILKLMEALEDLDDVTAVTANFQIPAEIMEKIAE